MTINEPQETIKLPIEINPIESHKPLSEGDKNLIRDSINVNKLGYYLDGWADLVEGMGEKVETVRSNVINELQRRNMPQIQISELTGYVSLINRNDRTYTVTTTSPGATTTIYIGQHGVDLYAAWRTFIKPVLNWNNILVTFIGCAVLAMISTGATGGSFFGWLWSTILLSIFAGFILAVAGKIFRGDSLAFFFIQPNLFDADDITAMGLAAHKSILRALDGAGIDVSKLRLKRDFKGGRRDEVV